MARTLSTTARTKMLEAAADLIVEAGMPGFSIDEVSRRSGVAKTTIYRHFPGGKGLLVAALDRTIEPPPIPDTGSLLGDVLAYLRSIRPLFVDPGLRTLWFEIYAASTRDEELRDLQRGFMAGRSAPTRAIYEHARERGELAPDLDYPTMIEIIQGPLISRSMGRPELLTDESLEPMAERIVAGLRA